ncbi:AsmA family protein [Ferrovibrio sp.]|uniref:AsmA family protein n=1 Tax=Ferrovibrio sp. TaxID=1917215 RepID=UPI0035126E1F
MRALKWIAIVLVLIVAAAVVVLLTVDVNRFKPQIVAAVEDATGRKLDIAADMKLSLFPLGVSVKKVSFGNAGWGSRPQMATIGEFTADLDLFALLQRQIKVDRLVLSDVDLLLERNAKGDANWEFARAGGPGAAPAVPVQEKVEAQDGGLTGIPVVSDVLLKNVKLAWRDAQAGAKNDLLLRQLSVKQVAGNQLAVRLAADLDGNEVAAEGVLGSLAELMAPSRPWPVRLAVTLPGATANLDGTIAQPLQGKGLVMKVIAEVPDLAKLANRFGASAPAAPLQMLVELRDRAPQHFLLRDITAQIGGSDLSGNGEIMLGGARPAVKFDLASKSFDIVPLLDMKGGGGSSASAAAASPAPAGGSQAPAPAGGRLFSDDPLPLDGLKAVDADVTYRAASLRTPALTAANVALSLLLKDGVLNLRSAALDAAGGHVAGTGSLNGPGKTLGVKLDATGIDLSGYLKQAAITDILNTGGVTDLALDVTSRGGSLHQLMAGLNGKVTLKVGEGELKEEYMKSFLPRLADAVGILGRATAKTKLYCVVSGLDIRDGVVTPRSLLAETGRISLTGQGDVNLGTEQLALLLVPSSRDVSLSAALPPVRVRGSLTDPSFSPDPAALAKSVIGAAAGAALLGPMAVLSPVLGKSGGDDSAAACAKAIALAEGKPVPQTKAPPAGSQQQKPASPLNELKDIGKSLKGLLGR